MTDTAQGIEQAGFAILRDCLDDSVVESLHDYLGDAMHAQRNLLSVLAVRDLAAAQAVRKIIVPLLGAKSFAVRGILFNKTQRSNWKVTWHQDLTIAVRERREVNGFGPWSVKAGVLHVQPPAEIMQRILAVRLHLDESGPDNGPLRVIPASHREGRLSRKQVENWREKGSVTCIVPRGGALLMRPLLLHASSECVVPKPRRVIHLEFASEELPQGLEWHDRA